MRDVIGSATRRAASRESTQHEHERGVEERDDEDQHGQHGRADKGNARVEYRDERNAPEDRADEQTAAIAHEQTRARTVPIQKTRQRPDERDEQDEQPHTERGSNQRRHECGRDERHSRGQAVHVVEKIESVAQSGKPDGAYQRVAGGEGAVGLDTRKRKHEERADGERGDQLRDRRQLQPVVKEADDEHRETGRKDGRPFHDVGLEQRSCQADAEADDRAQPRSRCLPWSASARCASGRGVAARRRRTPAPGAARPLPPQGR